MGGLLVQRIAQSEFYEALFAYSFSDLKKMLGLQIFTKLSIIRFKSSFGSP